VHQARPSIRVPAGVLPELVRGCERAGPEALGALRAAGRVAGTGILDDVGDGSAPESLGLSAYWDCVSRTLESSGFGPARYEVLSSGISSVVLPELPEADGRDEHPGCPFATGLLAGLLGRTAGEAVAVLEVECRAGGHPACRFLVGAEGRLREVREHLMGGGSLAEALEGP